MRVSECMETLFKYKTNESNFNEVKTAVEFYDEQKRVFGWRGMFELPPQRCCSSLFIKRDSLPHAVYVLLCYRTPSATLLRPNGTPLGS